MKVLDKIALVLFSCIILIMSALLCFVIFGWVKLDVMQSYLMQALNDPIQTNVILVILVVLILLSIKGIFFTTDTGKDAKKENGILIQNENGKLFITKDTIGNLVSGVVKEVEGAQDISSRVILSKDNSINIDVILFVAQDVVIKDLSNNLQLKIKEAVKKSMDVDIKEVNIKIKNIAPELASQDLKVKSEGNE